MKRLWHIYYGTRGSAGAYIDGLQNACLQAGQPSTAFVSCAYRFPTRRVVRLFFPFTDYREARNGLVLFVRAVELAVAYLILGIAALVRRPVVNLSLTDDSVFTRGLFGLLKLGGLKVWLTCHDVTSHNQVLTKRRLRLLRRADRLVVHSQAAYQGLTKILGRAAAQRVVNFPFPWTSPDAILRAAKYKRVAARLRNRCGARDFFLFIGVVRKAKGLDVLLDAWREVQDVVAKRLVIAGKWSPGCDDLRATLQGLHDVVRIERYVSDEEFVWLIRNALCVVLPYHGYSHSSILTSCAKLGAAVIASDTMLLKEYLGDYEWMFPNGSSGELASRLSHAAQCPAAELAEMRQKAVRAAVDNEREMVSALRRMLGSADVSRD